MPFLEKILSGIADKNDIYLSRYTSESTLTNFFPDLFPVKTEHPLIRIGGMRDGGYLVPDDLSGIKYCFSPGVSNVSDFESDLANRGIRSFMADYSVDGPPQHNQYFDFEKKFLGNREDEKMIRLENWVNRKIGPEAGDLILQMDIEGGEYDVLLDMSDDLMKRFRILAIEFHRLKGLYNVYSFPFFQHVFKKITKHFSVVHIHPNNCCGTRKYRQFEIPQVMEFIFLRKDRIKESAFERNFPHELDEKNIPGKADIILPKCWYARD